MTPEISDGDFALFQGLVRRASGISVPAVKKSLLAARLGKRVAALGLRTFSAYHRLLQKGDPRETAEMLNCLCTHETRFFREPIQFEFLEARLFPRWKERADRGLRPRIVRAWSAACSTGEEPFSLAMSLLDHFPPEAGWRLEVLASDLSTRALQKAEEATWPLEQSSEIPPDRLKRHMLRGVRSQDGRMKAGPALREIVRFQRVNLNDDVYPVQGPFDLIFCRNVMIYFDAEVKGRVLSRLTPLLGPDGHLFLGLAEGLVGFTDAFRPAGPMVYVPAGRSLP